jgi:hypothetical protein
MAGQSLAHETDAFGDLSVKLDRAVQVRRARAEGGPLTKSLMPFGRERFTGCEAELIAWLDGARTWLGAMDDHLIENAPQTLTDEESASLWAGTRRLRKGLIVNVFSADGTLGRISGEEQQGAELRYLPTESLYIALMSDLEPYRELERTRLAEVGWVVAQTPTEVRQMFRQRTADAAEIRKRFHEFRTVVDVLLEQLRHLLLDEE